MTLSQTLWYQVPIIGWKNDSHDRKSEYRAVLSVGCLVIPRVASRQLLDNPALLFPSSPSCNSIWKVGSLCPRFCIVPNVSLVIGRLYGRRSFHFSHALAVPWVRVRHCLLLLQRDVGAILLIVLEIMTLSLHDTTNSLPVSSEVHEFKAPMAVWKCGHDYSLLSCMEAWWDSSCGAFLFFLPLIPTPNESHHIPNFSSEGARHHRSVSFSLPFGTVQTARVSPWLCLNSGSASFEGPSLRRVRPNPLQPCCSDTTATVLIQRLAHLLDGLDSYYWLKPVHWWF